MEQPFDNYNKSMARRELILLLKNVRYFRALATPVLCRRLTINTLCNVPNQQYNRTKRTMRSRTKLEPETEYEGPHLCGVVCPDDP